MLNLNLLAIEYALGEYERGMISLKEFVETVKQNEILDKLNEVKND